MQATTLIKDPVCGMTVDPSKAAAGRTHDGATYHFCSKSCAAKFDADPLRYLGNRIAGDAPAPCAHCVPAPTAPVVAGFGVSAKQSEKEQPPDVDRYTCPMDPEVIENQPGPCPKCGMALERITIGALPPKTKYTCPMHPEIVRDAPGSCPICGMALEPRDVAAEEDHSELDAMTRRFWISAILTAPVFALGMLDSVAMRFIPMAALQWIELLLATPVVLWGGFPFFVRGWQSVKNRSPNMFTLIAIGAGVAYAFSLLATTLPQLFPPSLRAMGGAVPVYFEAAAVIVTLVLLGQVLELRARSRTGSAIKALLGLAP